MASKKPTSSQPEAGSPQKFTAKQVCDATGLTYRKLNDWDSRGLLPHKRDGKRGWREFTPLQVIALRIIADLKREIGVPLKQMRFLRHWMLGESWKHSSYGFYNEFVRTPLITSAQKVIARANVAGWDEEDQETFRILASAPPDHFRLGIATVMGKFLRAPYADDLKVRQAIWNAVRASGPIFHCAALAANGSYVTLFTDFNAQYWFVEEPELVLLAQEGVFEHMPPLIFPVNRSVNHALLALGIEPFPPAGVRKRREQKRKVSLTEEEQMVLDAVRALEVGTVTARVKGGRLASYEQQEVQDTSKADPEDVLQKLRTGGHVETTLKEAFGKIVRVERTRKHRFSRQKKARAGDSEPSRKR